MAGGPAVDFDGSLSDVLDNLDGAFFLSACARDDRLVFLADVGASDSSREGLVPPGMPAEGEIRQRSMTFLAGCRVVAEPRVAVDLPGGLRTWDVEVSAAAPAGGLPAGADISFTDPIAAARASFALSPRASAILCADLGGFGAGSEMTHQAVATPSTLRSPTTCMFRGLAAPVSRLRQRRDGFRGRPVRAAAGRDLAVLTGRPVP